MGVIVPFRKRHARAPSVSRLGNCTDASRSKVIPDKSLRRANSTSAGHQSDGIRPRRRQLETTGASTPIAPATAVVPPSSSMIVATDMEPAYFTPREHVKLHEMGGDLPPEMWTIALMAASAIAIGRRLVALHEGLGISQADVCRAIGVAPNRYSQYVNGQRRLTVDVAAQLVREYGVTLDWLYLDDRSKLSQELREKIPRAA